jgi:ABC-type multidrug transport system fused ATPase/permease subunit
MERHFREWILPRWQGAVGVMLLTIMVAVTSSCYPLIIKYAADSVEKRDATALPVILFLVVVVAAAKGLFMYLQILSVPILLWRRGPRLGICCRSSSTISASCKWRRRR